ncbi:MAG: hypothetical protein ACTSYC_02690, partial [Promethearchaeota archaeon]
MFILKYKKKPSVIQMQLTDYLSTPKIQVFRMNIPKEYRMAMKLLYGVPRRAPRKRGRKRDHVKLFYKMDHFIKKTYLTRIKPKYLRRVRDVPILSQSEIQYEGISK